VEEGRGKDTEKQGNRKKWNMGKEADKINVVV
jgi:hypothetical protein